VTVRDPVTDLDRRGRLIFASVLAAALLHGLLYITTIPPWDLFDEEQHLSYALYLREERRIPEITDPVQPRIIDNAAATDRWERFRIGRPASLAPDQIGLEGQSYEGYQPPLYYAAVAVATLPGAGDAWRELYLGRLFGALLLVGMAVVAWGYARDWLAQAGPPVWGAVALAVIAVPAMAGAAGRVNNDLMAALLIAAGVLLASRLLEDGRVDEAFLLGLLSGAALLTKSHGVLLLFVALAALAMLYRRQQLRPLVALLALGPGLVALAGWTLWTWSRYGALTGADAFLDLITPFEPLSPLSLLEALWLNGWSSYWGAYDGGLLRWITGFVIVAILAAGIAGIVRARAEIEREVTHARLVLSGTLAICLLAVVVLANESGLAHPHGRMILALYPALATLAAGGLFRLAGAEGVVFACGSVVLLSAVYYLGWFLPFFY
jgi:hypothetical protein